MRQRFTSRITAFEAPRHFQDTMVRGAFSRFVHDHTFEDAGDGATEMVDRLWFQAPLGPLGRAVDRLVLGPYLGRFLDARNAVIRRVAESANEWRAYVRKAK